MSEELAEAIVIASKKMHKEDQTVDAVLRVKKENDGTEVDDVSFTRAGIHQSKKRFYRIEDALIYADSSGFERIPIREGDDLARIFDTNFKPVHREGTYVVALFRYKDTSRRKKIKFTKDAKGKWKGALKGAETNV